MTGNIDEGEAKIDSGLEKFAGYIDEFPEKEENSTAAAGIIGAEDFSKEELAQVNQYIAFIKSQRK